MSTQNLESVSELVARLGPPPDDIAGVWHDEARTRVATYDANEFDANDPLWEEMLVDDSGGLVIPKQYQTGASQNSESPELNHHTFEPENNHEIPDVDLETESQSSETLIRDGNTDHEPSSTTTPSSRKGLSKPVAVVAGVVALVGVGVGIFAWNSSPDSSTSTAMKTDGGAVASGEPSELSKFGASDSIPATAASELSSDSLATVMDSPSMPSTEPFTEDANVDSSLLGVSLDSFLPSSFASTAGSESIESATGESTSDEASSSLPAAEGVPSTAPNIDTIATATPEDMPSIDIASDDDSLDDEAMLEAAEEQETITIARTESQTLAAELPGLPSKSQTEPPPWTSLVSNEVVPAKDAYQTLTLEFPTDGPLKLRSPDNRGQWNVVAETEEAPIAEIRSRLDDDQESNGLAFRWLPASSTFRRSADLAHARLRGEQGDLVYLRPQLDADAILLGLKKRDEKLKWNLAGPVDGAATRFNVTLHVPDDVAVEWIEPINETSPRKTRGIALLTLKESPEAAALAVRMDVRTTSSLSMRIRYGGRLDPSMPWQWTDAKTIRSTLDAVTRQLQLADEQLLMLDAAISRADKMRARRQEAALEMQRDQIEDAVKGGTTMAKRLAELDQLVALLDADGKITSELNVHWPDGSIQTLLNLR
ncbi:hypothetical protein [Rhodopirellula sallentina]|uniref:Transmembrane protein n=1 Tax=Rhodopirellula sallentina SM41 TaxID=1263870 RepID=M5UN19_9BACT|nr:hypothetical protein [Rhodopirellula sallentina]EMI57408.1 transmembrane protein [Rhodopirellula sallentina SM41]